MVRSTIEERRKEKARKEKERRRQEERKARRKKEEIRTGRGSGRSLLKVRRRLLFGQSPQRGKKSNGT